MQANVRFGHEVERGAKSALWGQEAHTLGDPIVQDTLLHTLHALAVLLGRHLHPMLAPLGCARLPWKDSRNIQVTGTFANLHGCHG
jgi:hypothetical protein